MTILPNTETETPPTAVELVKRLVKNDAASTTLQRVRKVLDRDPEFDSLCFDCTKYQPMINGAQLQDRDLSITKSYLTDNYRREVCTFTGERANDLSLKTTVKEAVEAVAHANRFNPRTKYILDCYKEHGDSGVALLDTWLEKVGCVIDADKKALLNALGRKYLIQSVARVFHPGCQADMGLILHDPIGDKSKSKFWRTLAVKPEWINESGIGDLRDEKKTGELLSLYWYVIFDENSSLTRSELGALKKVWTLTKDTYRSAYDIYASDKLRQCVFGGTTNILNLFLDEGGIARRFPIIDVSKVDTEWLKQNRDQLYAAAFHVFCQNLKSGTLTHDPDVDHGYDPVTIHNDDYLSDEERIKGNCHWWFAEDHETALYAMLTDLSARTLVTLNWQEELDFHLGLLVGQKITNRALKEKLGPYVKVTEDQIGRYMMKSGLHTKFDKVNYTYINPNAGIDDGGLPVRTLRLSGWLIGGDSPSSEISKKPTLQRAFTSMFDSDVETTSAAKSVAESPSGPVLITAQDVENDFKSMGPLKTPVLVTTQDVENDLDPSVWTLE